MPFGRYRLTLIRSVVSFALMFMIVVLAAAPRADALSDAESIKMFTDLVHSYYENDPDTFWEIISKFENRQFKDLKDCRFWMERRLASQMTYLKVEGLLVSGMAMVASEKLGEIDFRFDGLENAPSRVIVVTAFVDRVIEFDDSVPPEHRKIDQMAVFKMYVTLIEERLVSYKSDEINLGYYFASRK